VRHYDSSVDRVYNCALVYRTPDGRLKQFNTRAIAPTADQALALAERHLTHDKRRVVAAIVHKRSIEQ